MNPGNDQNGNIFGANALAATLLTTSQPSYITTAATGAQSSNIGSFLGYEQLDTPLLIGTANEGNDGVAANLLSTGTGNVLEFTVGTLAPNTTVRVGVVAVLNDDSRDRFSIPTIGLTDGTNSAAVTTLPNLSDGTAGASLGWVFFDLDAAGDYVISALGGAPNPAVGGIRGVTFDSIVVPEPSTSFLAGLTGLAFAARRRR